MSKRRERRRGNGEFKSGVADFIKSNHEQENKLNLEIKPSKSFNDAEACESTNQCCHLQ